MWRHSKKTRGPASGESPSRHSPRWLCLFISAVPGGTTTTEIKLPGTETSRELAAAEATGYGIGDDTLMHPRRGRDKRWSRFQNLFLWQCWVAAPSNTFCPWLVLVSRMFRVKDRGGYAPIRSCGELFG